VSKISPFNNWLGESEDSDRLNRLIQLGMAKELTPIQWIAELLDKDPEWDPMPAMHTKQYGLAIYNRISGGQVQLTIDCRFEDDPADFGEPIVFVIASNVGHTVTSAKTYEIPEGLDYYGVAQLIIKTIRDRYSVDALSESTGNIARLVNLGIVPDRPVAEWVDLLTQDEPNLSVVNIPADTIFTVQHGRDKAVVRVKSDCVEIQYSEADSPRSWVVRYNEYQGMIIPGDTNLTIAQKVIDKIKGLYKPVLPESLDRLAQLGMVPDKPFTDWILDEINTNPEFSLHANYRDQTVYLNHVPTGTLIGVHLNKRRRGEPKELSIVYTDPAFYEPGPEKSRPKQWLKKLDPTASQYEIARLALQHIKAKFSAVPESLDRLVSLGIAPDLGPIEWLGELLPGDPDFSFEPAAGDPNMGYVKKITFNPEDPDDAKNIGVRLVLTSQGRIYGFQFWATRPDRQLGTWQGNVEPETSNLEIAQTIAAALRQVYVPGDTGDQTPLSEAVDIEKIKRLVALGVIPEPKNSWSLVDALVKKEYPDYSIDSDSTRISLYGRGGWSVDLYRTSVLSYEFNYSAPDGTDTGRRWQLPRSIAAGQTHKHKYEVAEAVFTEIKKFIDSVLK